ncbi:methyltransferase domain-containing protein [Arenibacter certesii]|uniref:SAM-dependent methyltransferase n=1 Tax=Arenibacter certesii TaxID=228955 RepID=A0A918MQ59_9FLAO|nr:methyltransferase domain-containing protein [Arenibacter certesii]GGW44800.1 SAM-dependent methyltransferase [Arenibacter certesii]
MMKQSKELWENRYQSGDTGWDIGYASPPLTTYIDQLPNKDIKILIPGAGNAYELIYLVENGFDNVYVVDIAKAPLDRIRVQLPNYPVEQLIEGDFFDLDLTGFDLILEQTFFCALDPNFRPKYVHKMKQLLKPTGKLVGLLFTFPLTKDGPPYGGSLEEYKALFKDHFKFKVLEVAYNSIKPREDKELFFIFEPK